MFVYVALGAVTPPAPNPPPGGFSDFSSTSFDKLRDACARLGGGGFPLLLVAGVEVPLVERPSSAAGVASPLTSCGVASAEASRLDASPTMALRFLFRRWLGFQLGLRKFLWIEWMSSCSRSSMCASCASVGAAIMERKLLYSRWEEKLVCKGTYIWFVMVDRI